MTTKKSGATITLTFTPWGFDRLYSPDGRHHLLLCDVCGVPEWVTPVTEAFVCDACANARDAPVEAVDAACPTCDEIEQRGGFGPSHDGSPRCASGSIAAGGTHAHCACDVCF